MPYVDFVPPPPPTENSRSGGFGYTNPSIYQTTPPNWVPNKIKIPALIWRLAALLVGLGVIGWVIFQSPLFVVNQITVRGQVTAEVQGQLDALKGKNLFLLGGAWSAERLKQEMPQIKNAVIIRGLPHTIIVQINERASVLIWQSQNQKLLADRDGVAFKLAGTENLPLVVDASNLPISIGQPVAGFQFIDSIRMIYASFPGLVGKEIDRLEIGETTLQATIITKNGPKVLLDMTRTLTPQFSAAKKVLADHGNDIHQYLDLRVAGLAYYK